TSPSSTSSGRTWRTPASSDNVGVAADDVYRGGTKVGSPTTTSYSDRGLTPSTAYQYYVIARDAAGNPSPQSNTANATTQAAPSGNTLTFTPTDDSYAEQGATTPFGGSNRIVTDNSPVRHMYLRFDVSGTGGRRVL